MKSVFRLHNGWASFTRPSSETQGQLVGTESKKSRANSEPARVYKLASLSTLTGPDFAFDFFVPSRLTAAGLDLNTERVGLPVAQCWEHSPSTNMAQFIIIIIIIIIIIAHQSHLIVWY